MTEHTRSVRTKRDFFRPGANVLFTYSEFPLGPETPVAKLELMRIGRMGSDASRRGGIFFILVNSIPPHARHFPLPENHQLMADEGP